MEENLLLIGKLAKQIGINPKTIRYYEGINLLPKPNRGINNYRTYTEDTLNRLKFIKKAQSLGFTLREIKEVLTISDSGLDPCEHIGDILKAKMIFLERKLQELKSLQTKIKKLEKEWSNIQIKTQCKKNNLICAKIDSFIND